MIGPEEEADIEGADQYIDRVRMNERRRIEHAILSNPGLSLQVRLIIKNILDDVED